MLFQKGCSAGKCVTSGTVKRLEDCINVAHVAFMGVLSL